MIHKLQIIKKKKVCICYVQPQDGRFVSPAIFFLVPRVYKHFLLSILDFALT